MNDSRSPRTHLRGPARSAIPGMLVGDGMGPMTSDEPHAVRAQLESSVRPGRFLVGGRPRVAGGIMPGLFRRGKDRLTTPRPHNVFGQTGALHPLV